jgi:hypothetical protein
MLVASQFSSRKEPCEDQLGLSRKNRHVVGTLALDHSGKQKPQKIVHQFYSRDQLERRHAASPGKASEVLYLVSAASPT